MADFGLGLLQGLQQGIKSYSDRSAQLEELEAKKLEKQGLIDAEKAKRDEQRNWDRQKLKADSHAKGLLLDFDEQGNVVDKGYDPEWQRMQREKLSADPFGNKQLSAELAKANLNEKNTNAPFKSLPMENQEQVKTIAGKTANAKSIKNAIESSLLTLDDPKIPDDQKLTAGRALIKTLNSTQGADAVGAEEAKRLAGFLEYRLGNFFEPGPFIGRDLNKFTDQVKIQRDTLGNVIKANDASTDELYGRKGLINSPAGNANQPPPAPKTFTVISPNGKEKLVTESQLNDALQNGGRLK